VAASSAGVGNRLRHAAWPLARPANQQGGRTFEGIADRWCSSFGGQASAARPAASRTSLASILTPDLEMWPAGHAHMNASGSGGAGPTASDRSGSRARSHHPRGSTAAEGRVPRSRRAGPVLVVPQGGEARLACPILAARQASSNSTMLLNRTPKSPWCNAGASAGPALDAWHGRWHRIAIAAIVEQAQVLADVVPNSFPDVRLCC
jgi:hypothetical protein